MPPLIHIAEWDFLRRIRFLTKLNVVQYAQHIHNNRSSAGLYKNMGVLFWLLTVIAEIWFSDMLRVL